MQNEAKKLEEKKKQLVILKAFPENETKPLDYKLKLELVFFLNSLENSTLSRAETDLVISQAITIGGKTLAEQNNAVSLALAIEWLQKSSRLSRYDISEQTLLSLHYFPTNSQEQNDQTLKYSYRVPYVLSEYVEWLQQSNKEEVGRAVEAFNKLIVEQPFGEKTSRTAFLFLNLLLLQAGYPLVFIEEKNIDRYKNAVVGVMRGLDSLELQSILYESITASLDWYIDSLRANETAAPNQLLKIGQLAKLTGESIPTLRHWTKNGLLQVAEHTQGGYQLYAENMARVVLKIREWQRTERKNIAEIRELLKK